jgi:hypothetical protein
MLRATRGFRRNQPRSFEDEHHLAIGRTPERIRLRAAASENVVVDSFSLTYRVDFGPGSRTIKDRHANYRTTFRGHLRPPSDPTKYRAKGPVSPRKQILVAHSPADCYINPEVLLLDTRLGSKNFHRFKGSPRYAYFMENCRILL